MTADWLQGPYIYSLCTHVTLSIPVGMLTSAPADRDEFNYTIRVVAALFVLGFLSAGLLAPFVGEW